MKKISFSDMRCSLARSLDMIGDWWTPLIVRDIFLGVTRFDDLVEDLGISRNLLTRRLKHLVAKGVPSGRPTGRGRTVRLPARPDAGADLIPAILALTAWGDRWAPPAEGRPMAFLHRTCGAVFEARVTCSGCGGEIEAATSPPCPAPAARPGREPWCWRQGCASGAPIDVKLPSRAWIDKALWLTRFFAGSLVKPAESLAMTRTDRNASNRDWFS